MERRTHPRFLTLTTAKIVGDNTALPIDCAILNFSESGAALLVPGLTTVPEVFRLVIDPDGAVRTCRLLWRTGNRIGVRFRHADDDAGVSSTALDS
jgi:hypothetical protein